MVVLSLGVFGPAEVQFVPYRLVVVGLSMFPTRHAVDSAALRRSDQFVLEEFRFVLIEVVWAMPSDSLRTTGPMLFAIVACWYWYSSIEGSHAFFVPPATKCHVTVGSDQSCSSLCWYGWPELAIGSSRTDVPVGQRIGTVISSYLNQLGGPSDLTRPCGGFNQVCTFPTRASMSFLASLEPPASTWTH